MVWNHGPTCGMCLPDCRNYRKNRRIRECRQTSSMNYCRTDGKRPLKPSVPNRQNLIRQYQHRWQQIPQHRQANPWRPDPFGPSGLAMGLYTARGQISLITISTRISSSSHCATTPHLLEPDIIPQQSPQVENRQGFRKDMLLELDNHGGENNSRILPASENHPPVVGETFTTV